MLVEYLPIHHMISRLLFAVTYAFAYSVNPSYPVSHLITVHCVGYLGNNIYISSCRVLVTVGMMKHNVAAPVFFFVTVFITECIVA